MPTDLVGVPAAASLERPLAYEMTRLRTVLGPPNIAEEEPNLVRSFLVPVAREFGLLGTARISATVPDDVVDRALGLPAADGGGITAWSSSRLPTTFASRASSALDGDLATVWTPDVGDPTGSWIEVATSEPVTFDRLDLAVVADGRHSVPTRVTISAGGETRTVDVPAVADEELEGATDGRPAHLRPAHRRRRACHGRRGAPGHGDGVLLVARAGAAGRDRGARAPRRHPCAGAGDRARRVPLRPAHDRRRSDRGACGR